MKSNMQKTIMRRVYYSYGLSIMTHVMFWQGVFLGAAALLLAKWLHVSSIISNFLAVPVGRVPQYILSTFWSAATHGEFLTAFTLVLAGGVAVSVGYHITQVVASRLFVMREV
jgi:hypothetical protein